MDKYIKKILDVISKKSCNNEIVEERKDHYNKSYSLYLEDKRFFVKEIVLRNGENVKKAKQRVEIGERISEYFNKHGVSTCLALKNDNNYVLQEKDRVIVVYPYIDGKVKKYKDITILDCIEIGKVLARLHNNQGMEESFIPNDITSYTFLNQVIDRIKDLPKEFASFICKYQVQISDIQQKSYLLQKEMMRNCVISHRDLHYRNIIFEKKRNYIIDWELSGKINPLFELLDTALAWSGFMDNEVKFDFFQAVCNSYFENIGTRFRDTYNSKYFFTIIYADILEEILKWCYLYTTGNVESLYKIKEYYIQLYNIFRYEKRIISLLTKLFRK